MTSDAFAAIRRRAPLLIALTIVSLSLILSDLLGSNATAAAPVEKSAAATQSPPSAIAVHVIAPPGLLSDAYVQAEDEIRKAGEQTWIPLGAPLGSIRMPWWRQRMTWNIVGTTLEVDEDLHHALTYAPPGRADASTGTTIHCGTAPPTDPPGALHVKVRARLSLTTQYRLQATGSTVDMDWKTRCAMPALTQDPSPVLRPHLKAERERIAALAVTKLAEAWPLQPQIAQAWRTLQEPILVDEPTSTWLVLAPRGTIAGPVTLRGEGLAATVAVTLSPTLVRGAAPPATAIPLPTATLPAEGPGTMPPSTVRATFDVPVPFQEADERLREALVGQQFSLGLGSATIQAVRFASLGDRAQVELDVDMAGLTTVRMELTGTPVFDEPTQTVSFAGLNYAIKSRSAMTDFAESLLHDEFRRQLEKRLTIDLTPRLAEARRHATESLDREWKGGLVQGTVKTLRLRRLTMERTRFLASLSTEADIHYLVGQRKSPPTRPASPPPAAPSSSPAPRPAPTAPRK